jgi:hypothetical protein
MSEDDDMLEKMYAAADLMIERDDNLLKAIAALAASGHMQIVPMPTFSYLKQRPTIMIPERMYNRMLELFPAKEKSEDA